MNPGRTLLWSLLAVAVLFGLVVLFGRDLAQGIRVPAGPPGSIVPEWAGERPVWVVTDEDGDTTVVDAVNPHRWLGMKELVGWCEPLDAFSAFYDGSRFDRQGHYRFGPAPHGLAAYEVKGRDGDQVQVGAALPPPPRGAGSGREPEVTGDCWIDPGTTTVGDGDVERPGDVIEALYHDEFPASRAIYEGAIVIGQGVPSLFCRELVSEAPPRCGADAPEVIDAFSDQEDGGTVVITGRFWALRSARGLSDVVVLPGGVTAFLRD